MGKMPMPLFWAGCPCHFWRKFMMKEDGGGRIKSRRFGVAARAEVGAEQISFDGAVFGPLAPIAEVAVAETVGPRLVLEQGVVLVLAGIHAAAQFSARGPKGG